MVGNLKAGISAGVSGWYREMFSAVIALVLGMLFYFSPHWDPLSKTSGIQGATYVCGLLIIVLLYLTVQAWPFVLGKVGSAFNFLTDLLFSLLPAVPIMFAFGFHLTNFYPQSQMNLIVAAIAGVTVLFDVIVLGGIGALVNRLTNDLYQMKGRNE